MFPFKVDDEEAEPFPLGRFMWGNFTSKIYPRPRRTAARSTVVTGDDRARLSLTSVRSRAGLSARHLFWRES